MQSVKNLLIWIIFMGVTYSIAAVPSEEFNYEQLPPLYATADYRDCLQQPSSSYCWVYAEIQADNSSPLWHYLWNHSNSNAYHYRHDQVYRGICTSQCNNGGVEVTMAGDKLLGSDIVPDAKYRSVCTSPCINGNYEDPVAGDRLLDSKIVQMAQRLHEISRNQKTVVDNGDNIQQCVNSEFRQRYNLSVKTFTTYCENPKEPLEKAHHNLCSFSLYRNYRRLVIPNHSPMGRDLQFVDCFRTILSLVIVGEHTTYTQFMPTKNPELFEQMYSNPFTLIIVHIIVCIELFFMLSGLMLCLKFKKGEFITPQSSIKECLIVFLRLLISRYLRYMPSLLLPILLTSNVMLYVQQGPFWRHVMEPNVVLCRSEWWSNLLMTANLGINNCLEINFCFFFFRYPKYKIPLYTVIGTVGALLPTIVGYIKKLPSIGTLTVESYRHIFLQGVETGEYLYLSTYSNLNGFFVGLICGEIYLKYLQHDSYKKLIESRIKYFIPLGWPIIPAIWYLGSKLLFQEPSIWTALYGILHRPLSLVIMAIIAVIYNMCGQMYGGIPNWPVFRPLARISYQVYLWHFIILVVLLGSSDKLIEISAMYEVLLYFKVYILAVIVSFFIAIMLEYPMAELLKVFELKKKSKMNKTS
ncbi:nose resistant to fluoxetine protein 6-like [Musca domestica]|uniref:Nose resistant to fluoxetine protein 6-like n=1 Tax=Musca domestica TaxID=7370 RepID=A0ABM3VLZ2_MUSDO|nr:nose resistant to fluoxetine protein 6-like [Musca domestica]